MEIMSDCKLEEICKFLYEEGLYPDVEQLISQRVAYFVGFDLRKNTLVLYSRYGHEEEIDLTGEQKNKIKEKINGKEFN